jgi:hypothetical protein
VHRYSFPSAWRAASRHATASLVALVLGCATAGAGPGAPATPAGDAPPAELQAFVVAVELLRYPSPHFDEQLGDAIRKLGAALPGLSPGAGARDRAARLAMLAAAVNAGPPRASAGDAVLAALHEAVDALADVPQPDRVAPYSRAARAALESAHGYASQGAAEEAARRVLVNVADGLLVSTGAEPVLAALPPGSPAPALAPPGGDDGARGRGAVAPFAGSPAVPEEAHRATVLASEAVATVSRARGAEARARIADALEALGRAVEAVGGAASRSRAGSTLAFELRRLRSGDAIALQAAAWVRSALLALCEMFPEPGGSEGAAWVGRARVAASAIDPDAGLVFQRARIQEALRSCSDALLALAGSRRAPGGGGGPT